MAVEAVGAAVLQNLINLLIHNSLPFFDHVIDQIEVIRIQLREMRGDFSKAEISEDPKAVEWATECLRVLFSAEDEIEKYVLSLSDRSRRNIGFFEPSGKTLRRHLHRLAAEIKRLDGIRPCQVVGESVRGGDSDPDEQEESGRSLADVLHLDTPVNRKHFTSTNPPDPEGPSLIGFTWDQEQLVHKLIGGGGGGGVGIIPVVGPSGSGKATLVRRIYNLTRVHAHFNCLAWVHALDESITHSRLLSNLLEQVLKSKEDLIPINADQAIHKIWESLKDKTYLVVLDHVGDIQVWNLLKSAFPNLCPENSRNKVILIIRDMKVATSIYKQEKCVLPHLVSKLSHKDSWELFTREAHLHQRRPSVSAPIEFKKKILQKCGGRPINIVLLGALLYTKGSSFKEWKWYLSHVSWHGLKIWQLSYNDLPSHSKLCLLYMALFPSELDIPVRRLHRLWLAEGFIRRSSLGLSEEDAVEECFGNLLQRNFIKISKFRPDGRPQRCRLPHAIREYLSKITHPVSPFYIRQGHLENESSASSDSSLLSYKSVRSYILFNSHGNPTPSKEVSNFISKIRFGVLRVLDLEGTRGLEYKLTLPDTLKKLFNLRYLGLRWTLIDHLPKSVGELSYLETLDLKRTYIISLPSSIWKLKHLKHINLPGIYLEYKQMEGLNSLTELRTLVGLVVADEGAIGKLRQLLELRELGVTCQLSSSKDLTNLSSWIQTLTNLKFLGLKSKDKMGQPSKINLPPLPNLSQLSHVSLLGKIEKLPPSNQFPPNLKVLALSVSRLNDDPMAILSKLPSLSVLRLLANSYLGTHMSCPKNGFKQLLVLNLWMLEELEEWTVEEGGMPRLKELNLRKCLKLTQLPIQFLDQPSLEELTLTSMPTEFVDKVKLLINSHTILVENAYPFTPLPWDKDPELWTSLEADSSLDDAES